MSMNRAYGGPRRIDYAEAGRLYLQGLSTTQVGEALGVTAHTIFVALRTIGVPTRSISEARSLRSRGNKRLDTGYITVSYGLGVRKKEHALIAEEVLGRPLKRGEVVHHINGIKTDNRADNLEWVTPKEHMGDKHRGMTGRYVRSPETREKYRQARLGKKDSEDVRQVKAKILEANRIRRPFRFNDIDYPSVAAAARAAGMHLSVFRKKHLPENFPS